MSLSIHFSNLLKSNTAQPAQPTTPTVNMKPYYKISTKNPSTSSNTSTGSNIATPSIVPHAITANAVVSIIAQPIPVRTISSIYGLTPSPQPAVGKKRSIIAIIDCYLYNKNYYAWNDLKLFCTANGIPYPTLYATAPNTSTVGKPTYLTQTTATSIISAATVPTFFEWVQSSTSLPAYDTTTTGWTPEMALDVQAAWGMSVGAGSGVATSGPHIVLVHAKTPSTTDLTTAIRGAVAFGADVVSMSLGLQSTTWIQSAFSGLESVFASATNTVFLASSGDTTGGSCYPACSPNVVGVGGTSLYVSENNRVFETLWNTNTSGGGFGSMSGAGTASQPAYQSSVFPVLSGRTKNTPDISAIADPDTGLNVYVNRTLYTIGGTSLAAPCMGGLVSIANQQRINEGKLPLNSLKFLTALYELVGSESTNGLYPIGTNSQNISYDLSNGLGTPASGIISTLLQIT